MKLTKNSMYVLTLDDGTEIVVSQEDAYMIWRELDAEFYTPPPTYIPYPPSTCPGFPSPNYWYSINTGGNS